MVSGDARFRGAHGGIASGRVFARNGDYLGASGELWLPGSARSRDRARSCATR